MRIRMPTKISLTVTVTVLLMTPHLLTTPLRTVIVYLLLLKYCVSDDEFVVVLLVDE